MRRTLLAAAALTLGAAAHASAASPMKWNSMPVFAGQGITQQGHHGTIFFAQIMSTTPDSQGYYETWTYNVAQAQESYADHLALETRAACNASGDNSCVQGQPGWQETLATDYFQHVKH